MATDLLVKWRMRRIAIVLLGLVINTSQLSAEKAGIGLSGSLCRTRHKIFLQFFDPSQPRRELWRITFKDDYWGMGLNVLYGPVWRLYARMTRAELQLYTAGGAGVMIFPGLGLDVLLTPFRWRFAPYLWAGASFSGFWGNQGTPDMRFNDVGEITPYYDLRGGAGLRYQFSRSLWAFVETQNWTSISVPSFLPHNGFRQNWVFSALGLLPVKIGVHYCFAHE